MQYYTHFIDWYSPVDSNLTPETVDARLASVKSILENDAQDFWLDLVRIYNGLQVKNPQNRQAFITSFKDHDRLLTEKGIENLLQTLAGVCICAKLESKDDINIYIPLALAVLNINFFGQYNFASSVPVLDHANHIMEEVPVLIRETFPLEKNQDIKSLKSNLLSESYKMTNKDIIKLIEAMEDIENNQKVFSEELNILWWLFGEYCSTKSIALKDMNLPHSIPYIAKELAALIQFEIGPRKLNSIVKKAISYVQDVNKNNYSTIEVINNFKKDEIPELLPQNITHPEFSPLLSAIKVYEHYSGMASWPEIYGNDHNKADLEKKFSSSDLAAQLIHEYLFLKNTN